MTALSFGTATIMQMPDCLAPDPLSPEQTGPLDHSLACALYI
jgi:hypothetical protein